MNLYPMLYSLFAQPYATPVNSNPCFTTLCKPYTLNPVHYALDPRPYALCSMPFTLYPVLFSLFAHPTP